MWQVLVLKKCQGDHADAPDADGTGVARRERSRQVVLYTSSTYAIVHEQERARSTRRDDLSNWNLRFVLMNRVTNMEAALMLGMQACMCGVPLHVQEQLPWRVIITPTYRLASSA